MKSESPLKAALLEYRAKVTELERENVELRQCLIEAFDLIKRYKNETPLGNQPHMIAFEAEIWIKRVEALVAGKGKGK